MSRPLRTLVLSLALSCSAAAIAAPAGKAPEPKAVVAQYADIAQAMYDDALASAKTLQAAVAAFLAKPDDTTLAAARKAWIDARPWYMQTEALRFGNPIVDEWEGRVNAWPLDEGLIDYVDAGSYGETSDENPLYRANVIANKTIRIGKKQVDASKIDKKLLREPAGGRRGRGQRRDRLPRHRVPALGPGPERHRTRRRRASGERLRHEGLHQRQLRPPRATI